MPQYSGKKRGRHNPSKNQSRPFKKFKQNSSNDNNPDQSKNLAKHPFKSPKKHSIIEIDKSSKYSSNATSSNKNNNNNNNNSKYKYEKPHGPLSKKEIRIRRRNKKESKSYGKLRLELNYLNSSHSNNIKISKLNRGEQHKYVSKILNKISGNLLNIIFKLDSTRVIQLCIKYGSQPQILLITKELRGSFINLSCDHYASRTVRSLLEYGRGEVRTIIISELMFAITRLILHRTASSVIDYAIMIISDNNFKKKALQYFLNPKYIIMLQLDGAGQPKSIENILNDLHISSNIIGINLILKNMFKFLNNGFEKSIISTGIYQNILYYYIKYYLIHSNRNKLLNIFELILIPNIMSLQNVIEGVMSIIYTISCSYWLKPSLRKLLIRNLNDTIISMCCDKNSYLIIIKLIDCYDDTVLINKIIIKQIIKHFHILMYHNFGKNILIHLLKPRNSTVFAKNKLYNMLCCQPVTSSTAGFIADDDDDDDDDIKMINDDNISLLACCKKDFNTRRILLLSLLLPSLIDYTIKNIKKLLCHDIGGVIVIQLLDVLLNDNDIQLLSNIKLIQIKINELMESIVYSSLCDDTAREMSPTPPLPQEPEYNNNNNSNVEINNIVNDSVNMVRNSNLSSIDLSSMDPKTVKNIQKLKQYEISSAYNKEYMKLNAEYNIKMINYNLIGIRHKNKIKKEDINNGLMSHGLGHRRLRKIVEKYNQIHIYFINILCDSNLINEDKIINFLFKKGVYVLYELYNNGNDNIQNKLIKLLKPICIKIKNIIIEKQKNDNLNLTGLTKLCNAMGVTLELDI